MSIIETTNPLNLQYKLCVVTNASSPLGVVLCKTLLKANALVLGIDKNPCDASLNAGLGTHFQFEKRDLLSHDDEEEEEEEGEVPRKIIQASAEKFESLGGKFDVLVNLLGVGEGLKGIEALSGAIGDVMMRQTGKGSILTICEESREDLIEFTRTLSKKYEGSSIRTNMLVPEATMADAQESGRAYEEAKTYMTALVKTEKSAIQSQRVPSKFYEMGNLVLFLACGMGEGISWKVVALDGSYKAL